MPYDAHNLLVRDLLLLLVEPEEAECRGQRVPGRFLEAESPISARSKRQQARVPWPAKRRAYVFPIYKAPMKAIRVVSNFLRLTHQLLVI